MTQQKRPDPMAGDWGQGCADGKLRESTVGRSRDDDPLHDNNEEDGEVHGNLRRRPSMTQVRRAQSRWSAVRAVTQRGAHGERERDNRIVFGRARRGSKIALHCIDTNLI